MALTETRATALKVARLLVGKGRPEEAVEMLCAWAVQGPNDAGGQELMAEALRINPAAPVARCAFERMEGVPGDHQSLDAAIQKFTEAEVEALSRTLAPKNFIRAQVGFNNNVKYKEQVFHIQTEDSGLDRPHVITHVFADGGRVIKSHKRDYAEHVQKPEVANIVRTLMKSQHMEMAIMLKEGRFDDIIAGKARGGLEVMTGPPQTEVKKRGRSMDEEVSTDAKPKVVFKVQGDVPASGPTAEAAPVQAAPAAEPAPEAAPPVAPPTAGGVLAAGFAAKTQAMPSPLHREDPTDIPTEVQPVVEAWPAPYRLSVERTAGGDPPHYVPTGPETIIGRSGTVTIAKERFAHPEEAKLVWKDDRLWLIDIPGGNGAFLRVQHLVELEAGDEFLVGDQLLRVDRNPDPYDDGPTTEPTYFYSSPKPVGSPFRVTQFFEGAQPGACVLARTNSIQIGSERCDLNFSGDPLISKQHCILEEQAGVIILTDLDSRTGVFVRVKTEQELMHGDEIIVGRTRLKVEFLQRRPKA
ncbi:MAG: FHA domain-containing protein [Polyangiaceae bacterium]